MGSFVATASDPRTGRADPKDKIGLFNKLGTAMDLSRDVDAEGREPFDQVVALLDSVVKEDPEVIDAWFMLGTQYLRHGEPAKAVEYFKKTLGLKPDYDLAVINMAEAYRGLGDDDAALAGFEHYLTLDPKDPYVRYQMGEISAGPGRPRQGRGAVPPARSISTRRWRPPRMPSASIALDRGDPVTAERLIREAIAIKPDVRLAHFNLALVAERRGDLAGAEREYVEELKLHHDSYKAAFNLSRLYEQVGDREGQIGALKQSIESNPRFPEGHIFLAKAYLDSGTHFDEAIELARKGLELAPKGEYAPLAHYVLADIFNRQGRPQDAAREVALGRALEARLPKGS